MSGQCIEKIAHKCGSSDGLQVFEEEGKYSGYCFSCGVYVPHPYSDLPGDFKPTKVTKSKEQIDEELQEIESLQTVSVPARKLRKETLEYFGVRVGLSETDGTTPESRYYPYYNGQTLIGYKAKIDATKQMWFIGHPFQEEDLFGWEQAIASGAKKLFITEGEDDAMALLQALKDNQKGTQWEHHSPAVVSLPKGAAGARKTITRLATKISSNFKEVVLVFDMDDAGRKATQDVLQIYPTAKTVTLPAKDANECLIKGYAKGLVNVCLFKAETPKNTRLILGSSLYEAARQQPAYGLSWPWAGLTDLTRGIRFGETVYIGAGVKMGKSEVVNALGAHLILEHGLKVLMAKPEEANRKTYQMMCGKAVGRIFHDPKIEFDYEAYDKASGLIGDKLYMLSLYQHLGWETLKADIRSATGQGCKAVFIDPITNLVNGVNSAEANTMLQEVAQELASMALDLNIVIFIFCHLKAPENGPPHERGGEVFSTQFAGSRAMMRSCNLMIGLEGNKSADLPDEERNLRDLIVLEDREFGSTGKVKLYWNRNTGLFSEVKA